MAYYSGTAADFDELKDAIEAACVTEGWSLTSNVLSKSSCFFQLIKATGTSGNVRLELQGGMGQAGSALTNACTLKGCITSSDAAPITFPISYELHIFEDPDEVYCVVNFNTDFYHLMAFGDASNVQGVPAPWFGGPFENSYTGSAGVNSSWSIGDSTFANNRQFVIDQNGIFLGQCNSVVGASWFCHNEILAGAAKWPVSQADIDGQLLPPHYIAGLISALPSLFNNTAVLLPLKVILALTTSRKVIVANQNNVRLTRNDNILPATVVPYGSEEWKVYPVYRRNTSSRNGASGVDSGTFAFAIRYTGP
jgi:hypothetical protein